MSGSKKQKLDPQSVEINNKENKKLKTDMVPTIDNGVNKTDLIDSISKNIPSYTIDQVIKKTQNSEISTIFKVDQNKKEKELFILKKYKYNSSSINHSILRELFFYKTYTHQYIPKIFGVRRDEKTGYYEIIMEHASMNLKDYMFNQCINTTNVFGFAAKVGITIGKTLMGLHTEGIYHTDTRILNIMIMPNETVKLIDFDSIRGVFDFKNDPWENLSSEKVIPPEIENNLGPLSESSDVFILGKSLFEMIYFTNNYYPGTYYPYSKLSYSENIKDMISFLRKVKNKLDEKTQINDINMLKCIISMITYEPCFRPKLSNCIEIFEAFYKEYDPVEYKKIENIPTTLTILPSLSLDVKLLDTAFLVNDRKIVIDLLINMASDLNFSLKEILVSYDALLTFLSNCGKIINIQNIQMYSIIGLFLSYYFLVGSSDDCLKDIALHYTNLVFSESMIQTMIHSFFATIGYRIITRKVNKKILKDFEKFIPTITLITVKEKELLITMMSDNNYITQNFLL